METHTSDKELFQRGVKKTWPENHTPAPSLPSFFFGTSYHTKRVQKTFTHWRLRAAPPTKNANVIFSTVHPRQEPKTNPKPLTQEDLKNRKPERIQKAIRSKGTIPERSKKTLTRKWNTCTPPLPGFFLGRPTTKRVQKSLHTQKGSKKNLRTLKGHGAKSSGNPYA